MNAPATQQIEQMFPQSKEVAVKGDTLVIKPFGFGQFPKLIKILKGANFGAGQTETTGTAIVEATAKLDVIDMLTENADVVLDICALASRKPRDWFDDVPAEEGVALAMAILSVNVDFFVNRLQPMLVGALEEFNQSVGQKLSQS